MLSPLPPLSTGELLQVTAGGNAYYVFPVALELLGKSLARSKLKILSPFDNLIIQVVMTLTPPFCRLNGAFS
jgi:hypothetical protein